MAFINRWDGSRGVADLPTVETAAGNRLHGRGILDILREWVPPGEPCILVVEDVRARPAGNGGAHGNSMFSQASLMRSRGIVEAVSDIAGVNITWAQPQTWKAHFRLKSRNEAGEKLTSSQVKELSRQMAIRLMPSMAPALARKKDDNRAEALLLAHWGLTMKA
jgi:hypothetical protein